MSGRAEHQHPDCDKFRFWRMIIHSSANTSILTKGKDLCQKSEIQTYIIDNNRSLIDSRYVF